MFCWSFLGTSKKRGGGGLGWEFRELGFEFGASVFWVRVWGSPFFRLQGDLDLPKPAVSGFLTMTSLYKSLKR